MVSKIIADFDDSTDAIAGKAHFTDEEIDGFEKNKHM